MREMGQYLTNEGAWFNVPSPWSLLGLAALVASLLCWTRFVVKPLAGTTGSRNLVMALALAAVAGVIAVCLLQTTAQRMLDEGPGQHPRVEHPVVRFPKLVMLVIGLGYSLSRTSADFSTHVAGFILGVGLAEELVKLLLTFGVAYILFGNKDDNDLSLRHVTAAAIVAGLGFGAGEALLYFQAYAGEDMPGWLYIARAGWCVPLHASWVLLSGVIVFAPIRFSFVLDDVRYQRFVPRHLSGVVLLMVLIGCVLPAAVLHGLYDATCLHAAGVCWVIGGLSLLLCGVGLLLISTASNQVPRRMRHPMRSPSDHRNLTTLTHVAIPDGKKTASPVGPLFDPEDAASTGEIVGLLEKLKEHGRLSLGPALALPSIDNPGSIMTRVNQVVGRFGWRNLGFMVLDGEEGRSYVLSDAESRAALWGQLLVNRWSLMLPPRWAAVRVARAATLLGLVKGSGILLKLSEDGHLFVSATAEMKRLVWRRLLLNHGVFRLTDEMLRPPRDHVDLDLIADLLNARMSGPQWESLLLTVAELCRTGCDETALKAHVIHLINAHSNCGGSLGARGEVGIKSGDRLARDTARIVPTFLDWGQFGDLFGFDEVTRRLTRPA